MRALNFVFGLVMVGFAAVQYNDPDGVLWAGYYTVPAACSIAVALRPQDFRGASLALLFACVGAVVLLAIFHWPAMPGFWRKDVWINEETAREGMGLMIASATTALAALTAARRRGTR